MSPARAGTVRALSRVPRIRGDEPSTTLDLESIGMLIYLIANPPTNEGKIREKLVEASPAAYKVVNRISQKLIAAGEIDEHRTRDENRANRFGSLVWEIVRTTKG